jgi:hypothetical protein
MPKDSYKPDGTSVRMLRLTFDGPNIRGFLFEGINVHHPSENLGNELATGSITSFLACDGAVQAELRAPRQTLAALETGR